MAQKIVYIGKTSNYFTHNKEYTVIQRHDDGYLTVDDDTASTVIYNISPDYFAQCFRHITLNEELEQVRDLQIERKMFNLQCKVVKLQHTQTGLVIVLIASLSMLAGAVIQILFAV